MYEHLFSGWEALGEAAPASSVKRAMGFFAKAKARGDREAQKYWAGVVGRAKAGVDAAKAGAGVASARAKAGAAGAARVVGAALRGEPHGDGHGSDHGAGHGSGGSFFDKLKGAAKALKDAPANLKRLATDREYRKEAAMSAGAALRRKAKAAWGTVKHEADEFKTAGKAVAKLVRKEPLTPHDKKAMKAAAKAVAMTVAGTVAMGGIGHLTAAALAKHFAAETAVKAVGRAALFASADGSEQDALMQRWTEMIVNGVADAFQEFATMTPEDAAAVLGAAVEAEDEEDEEGDEDGDSEDDVLEAVAQLVAEPGDVKLAWDQVLASRYKGGIRETVWHLSVETPFDLQGVSRSEGASLCGKVADDSLAGMVGATPPAGATRCPACLRMMKRLKLTEP